MDFFEEETGEPIHVIKGSCAGIALTGNENICFHVIVEDDENWYLSKNGFSAFWLPDLEICILKTGKWLEENARKRKDDFGWEIKD